MVKKKKERVMSVKPWRVRLTTRGNPDFNQWAPITDPETMMAESLDELRDNLVEWINYNMVGGGNWTEPTVYHKNKPVGFLSYNLKLWKLEMRSVPSEELYGPDVDSKERLDSYLISGYVPPRLR
mgnify:CR=1 FL=1